LSCPIPIYHFVVFVKGIGKELSFFIYVIGHVHVADCPGRHEPGTGEIHYPRIYQALADSNYQGIVGYELMPETTTAKAVEKIMSIV